jgi:hypothetical protein
MSVQEFPGQHIMFPSYCSNIYTMYKTILDFVSDGLHLARTEKDVTRKIEFIHKCELTENVKIHMRIQNCKI